MHHLAKNKGTYILILFFKSPVHISVGRLSTRFFDSGVFAYVGSALGPGGLHSRLKRHLSEPKSPHWHLDYILPHVKIMGALIRGDGIRRECQWSEWVSPRAMACIKAFGSSDCRCKSHLFYLGEKARFRPFVNQACSALRADFLTYRTLREKSGLRHAVCRDE